MRGRSLIGAPVLVMMTALLLASPSLQAEAVTPATSTTCTWKDVQSPFFSGQLFGVTALSDTDAWSVGYDTDGPLLNTAVIEHWNGKRWKVTPSPQPGSYRDFLEEVSGVSSTDIWTVGAYQDKHGEGVRPQRTLAEHWDGSSWSVIPSPNLKPSDNSLFSVAAISTDDVWAVGTAVSEQQGSSQTLIEHWDGASWSIVPSPDPGDYTNVLASISVVSPTDIWAVGTFADGKFGHGKTLTEHWDGADWNVVASPNLGTFGDDLGGVAAVSSNDVWAAGGYAYEAPDGSLETATMTDHWNGKRWSVVDTPDPLGGDNQLNGITALAGNQVWAVGTSIGGPVIIRWNGHAWITIDAPGPKDRWLWSLAALGPHDLWSVGSIGLDFLIMRGC